MAKGNYSGISCIEEHLKVSCRKNKKDTVEKYRGVLYMLNGFLKENGYSTNPREIDEETMQFMIDDWTSRNLAVGTKDWYLSIFNRYLQYFGNNVVEDMGIDFGYDDRPNAKWLNDEERDLLMECPKNPLQEVVVHLELCMGLRIVEVCRLRKCDIHFDSDPQRSYISVRGKGRGDGKWRNIPFHPDSREVFERWMGKRNEIVRKMKEDQPEWRDPDEFLISFYYSNKGTLKAAPYDERTHSLDDSVMNALGRCVGFKFTNHTLRRTFGRTLYHAGIAIETIASLYGHESVKTTIAYLGIDLSDMSDALRKMYEFQYGLSRRQK